MLTVRGRGAIAIVAGAALLYAAGDGLAREKKTKKSRKGKVVRVERTRVGGGLPRYCVNPRVDGGATCYGLPPEIGELGTVMDDTGTRASVRVTAVTATLDSCGNAVSWEVSSEVQVGDLSQLNTSIAAMVFDWKTTSRSKAMNIYGAVPVVVPGKYQDERMLGAVDDDGDDRADLMLTWFYCDASGSPSLASGQSGHYCVVHYAGSAGGAFRELRLDVVKNC